jgi:adenylosuccinate synthase
MTPHALLVAGLGFGDEGKGSAVDYLTRRYDARLVVRYNGGPQAAHHVVLPDGRWHKFQQFGSGYFAGPNVMTYLSKHMLVSPTALKYEADKLQDMFPDSTPHERIMIDENCLILTPLHSIANRFIEKRRGNKRHGTCGWGVGFARGRALSGQASLYARDLKRFKQTISALRQIQIDVYEMGIGCEEELKLELDNINILQLAEEYNEFANTWTIRHESLLHGMLQTNTSVFEGAQGVLLDETYGFAPHNTWTDTTFKNAHDLLQNTGVRSTRIGILRALSTRHGAGPFPSENSRYAYDGDHNSSNQWQGDFRFGAFDFPLVKYALNACGGVNELFLTHCDKLQSTVGGKGQNGYVDEYEGMLTDGRAALRFGVTAQELFEAKAMYWEGSLLDAIREKLKPRVSVYSYGPTHLDKVSG